MASSTLNLDSVVTLSSVDLCSCVRSRGPFLGVAVLVKHVTCTLRCFSGDWVLAHDFISSCGNTERPMIGHSHGITLHFAFVRYINSYTIPELPQFCIVKFGRRSAINCYKFGALCVDKGLRAVRVSKRPSVRLEQASVYHMGN